MTLALLATTCSLLGHGAFTAPDNHCTPGAYDRIPRAQACVSKSRPALPAADRRKVLAEYGVPRWSGRNGELDHRVPFFLGGRTDEQNIWPQRNDHQVPGYRNAKDRLEYPYIYDRVCHGKPHPMRVSTARRLFLGDWRVAYRRYFT